MKNNIVANIFKKRKAMEKAESKTIKSLLKKKGVKKINWKVKYWNKFSIYIRMRDALPESGLCFCISCGKPEHWKNTDAGHYINRQFTSIIYNELNVHAQCRSCNRFQEGNQAEYRKNIVKKYGENAVLTLEAAKGKKKYHTFELEALYTICMNDIKRIKQEKGI